MDHGGGYGREGSRNRHGEGGGEEDWRVSMVSFRVEGCIRVQDSGHVVVRSSVVVCVAAADWQIGGVPGIRVVQCRSQDP